jgi:hypothetical protein
MSLKSVIAGWLFASVIGTAAAVAQEARPVVVELYTSQGCSSCPPADALLEELAQRDDVIALAMHVDYWDYLGWKDTMGRPEHTERQKAYARYAGERSVYTPQMIVAGTQHIVGYKPMQLADAMSQAVAQDPGVELTARRSGASLVIEAQPENGLPGNMVVQVVRYIPRYDVAIKRGENAGRVITYVNAVTELNEIGRWNGRQKLSMRHKIAGDQPVVIILQEKGPGRILAAARLN